MAAAALVAELTGLFLVTIFAAWLENDGADANEAIMVNKDLAGFKGKGVSLKPWSPKSLSDPDLYF